jgi:hypothetical protein
VIFGAQDNDFTLPHFFVASYPAYAMTLTA